MRNREDTPLKRPPQAVADVILARVNVGVGDGYPVWITRGGVPRAAELLEALDPPLRPPAWALLTDERVSALHSAALREGLAGWPAPAMVHALPADGAKTWDAAGLALRRLAAAGVGRDGALVCLGGGAVGDAGGFVAGTYLRGVDFVNVPTTLLAVVDAAIGGKTGLDLPEGKNLVGVFHQPRAVLADLDLLSTLPAPAWREGWAEVIKIALICDRALVEGLEAWGPEPAGRNLLAAVERAVRAKAAIVAADEREAGPRRILNFGHTVGHALEAAGGYRRWSHGEAVALGMACALELGVRLDVTPPPLAARARALLRRFGLPTEGAGLEPADLGPFLARDKKAREGELVLVLIREIGKPILRRLAPGHPALDAAIRAVA